MFTSLNPEEKLHQLERKLEALHIQSEALDLAIETLFLEQQVSAEQLTKLISEEKNFTPANWETLQAEKKRLEEKLAKELANIPKLKQKREPVQSNWLFVR